MEQKQQGNVQERAPMNRNWHLRARKQNTNKWLPRPMRKIGKKFCKELMRLGPIEQPVSMEWANLLLGHGWTINDRNINVMNVKDVSKIPIFLKGTRLVNMKRGMEIIMHGVLTTNLPARVSNWQWSTESPIFLGHCLRNTFDSH